MRHHTPASAPIPRPLIRRRSALAMLGGMAGLCLAPAAARAATISHAFGTVALPARPGRIVSVGWANHEVPLALGVVPLGFARAGFGDDDGDGILPWVRARLDELGGPEPVLFDETGGIDFETVAALGPDVILAAYSGLSRSDYDTLSRIAPVVAYPRAPWTTGWRDMIRLNSAGIGRAAEGEALLARTGARIAATAAAHPELAGRRVVFLTHLDPTNPGRLAFYTDQDARVQFLHELGFRSPEAVREASQGGRFAAEISAERIDMLGDAEVIVTYGSPAVARALRDDPLLGRLPAVRRGALAMLPSAPLGTGAYPTPMSIPATLDDYVVLLSAAARAAS